jgi:hypothetical protein
MLQNTVPGTYNIGQGGGQRQFEVRNPYCGEVAKVAWYLAEFCRNPKLAVLSKQVEHLSTIYSMSTVRYLNDELAWQMHVDKKCLEAESPPDCLNSELERRSHKLQAMITKELASNEKWIFKEDARRRWAQHDW